MRDLEIKLMKDGSLELSLNCDFQEFKADNKGRSEAEVWAELIEPWQANGQYYMIKPEDIGALTSDPYLLSDDVEICDDGSVDVFGSVWCYNNYMTKSIIEELSDGYTVTLTLV